VTRLPLTDLAWAGRYDAIDLLAGRLHDHACTGAAGCTDVHWMAWTGPALAALADAHVYTHYHATGRRLVIEIDLPPGPGDPGSRDHDCGGDTTHELGPGGWCA
jgi:hypothetical protein